MTTETLNAIRPHSPHDAVRDAIEARLSELRQNVADFERQRASYAAQLASVDGDLDWTRRTIYELEAALSHGHLREPFSTCIDGLEQLREAMAANGYAGYSAHDADGKYWIIAIDSEGRLIAWEPSSLRAISARELAYPLTLRRPL